MSENTEVTIPYRFYMQWQLNPSKAILGHLFHFNPSQQGPGIKEDLVDQHGPKSQQEQRKMSISFLHSWKQKGFSAFLRSEKSLVAFPQEPSHTVKTTRPQHWKMARRQWPMRLSDDCTTVVAVKTLASGNTDSHTCLNCLRFIPSLLLFLQTN